MNAASQSRLSLALLVGTVLACVTAAGRIPHAGLGRRTPALGALLMSARPADPAEANLLNVLDELSRREPNEVDWCRVLASIEHRSWRVAGAALRVIAAHGHAKLPRAQFRLIERAVREPNPVIEPLAQHERSRARTAVLRDVLGSMPAMTDAARSGLLRQLFASEPDGVVRAAALKLVAVDPPDDFARWVQSALEDPSQSVRLAALDIVAERRWDFAAPAVASLAHSPRPAIRQRAIEVLGRLGRPRPATGSSESVSRAAAAVADRLWAAGLRPSDVLDDASDATDDETVGPILQDRLVQDAERYLDQPPGAGPPDGRGVLLLALACRTGQDKLARRLWQREVATADCDDELVSRGLEFMAQNRLLAALAACRGGDAAGALEEFAAVARLAPFASDDSVTHIYLRQARDLSVEVWRVAGSRVATSVAASPDSDLRRLAGLVFGQLDPAQPLERAELRRRLDAWCGLAAEANPAHAGAGAMAN